MLSMTVLYKISSNLQIMCDLSIFALFLGGGGRSSAVHKYLIDKSVVNTDTQPAHKRHMHSAFSLSLSHILYLCLPGCFLSLLLLPF